MDIFIFNFQRYLLLLIFFIIGTKDYFKNIKSSATYYRKLTLPILVYSIFEGTRWMRGADYEYNYNIANCTTTSGDVAYDGIAQFFHYIGLPYWCFFVFISAILIISLLNLCRNYKEAFFPCMIILYSFSMNQSENLMRQYTAISCMLISFVLFFENKFKWSFSFILIAYLCHSSVIFILPFFIFAVLFFKYFSNTRCFYYIPLILLVLYLCSSILEKNFYNILINFNVSDLSIENKYLSEDYYSKATNDAFAIDNENNSLLDIIRTNWRAITVILSGYIIFPKKNILYNEKTAMLFSSYFIGSIGYIYEKSLPNLTMEVMWRLGLYLYIFSWFFEGYVIYFFLIKKNKYQPIFYKFIKCAVIMLTLMEAIWILKPQMGNIHGLMFIWS